LEYKKTRNNRYKIKLNKSNFFKYIRKNPESPINIILNLPYWFQIFVYFDIINNEELILLTYGIQKAKDIPLVRIQHEALFNRFPLKDIYYKRTYQEAVKKIVTYGVGIIILLNSDTRGIGFGAYAQNIMLKQGGISINPAQLFDRFGVNCNLSDYEGPLSILKRHIQGQKIQMILDSPKRTERKAAYTEILETLDVEVSKWIFLKK